MSNVMASRCQCWQHSFQAMELPTLRRLETHETVLLVTAVSTCTLCKPVAKAELLDKANRLKRFPVMDAVNGAPFDLEAPQSQFKDEQAARHALC